jgi:hypothetical protein
MVLDIFTKIWRSSKYMSVKAANHESVFDFPIHMTKKQTVVMFLFAPPMRVRFDMTAELRDSHDGQSEALAGSCGTHFWLQT